MSATGWFFLGGAVWTALSIWLGVVIGRTVKRRDEQKPVAPTPLRNVGWGPFPLPGEKRHMDAAAEQARSNPPAGPRKGEQR